MYSKEQGELVGTGFVAYAAGLSVSGFMKSIDHYLPESRKMEAEVIKGGELHALPKEHWFIYESQ